MILFYKFNFYNSLTLLCSSHMIKIKYLFPNPFLIVFLLYVCEYICSFRNLLVKPDSIVDYRNKRHCRAPPRFFNEGNTRQCEPSPPTHRSPLIDQLILSKCWCSVYICGPLSTLRGPILNFPTWNSIMYFMRALPC